MSSMSSGLFSSVRAPSYGYVSKKIKLVKTITIRDKPVRGQYSSGYSSHSAGSSRIAIRTAKKNQQSTCYCDDSVTYIIKFKIFSTEESMATRWASSTTQPLRVSDNFREYFVIRFDDRREFWIHASWIFLLKLSDETAVCFLHVLPIDCMTLFVLTKIYLGNNILRKPMKQNRAVPPTDFRKSNVCFRPLFLIRC